MRTKLCCAITWRVSLMIAYTMILLLAIAGTLGLIAEEDAVRLLAYIDIPLILVACAAAFESGD